MKLLDQVLNSVGATQALLDSQATTTAATYAKLGGAVEDFKASLGRMLAEGLEPAVQGLTAFIQAATQYIPILQQTGDKTAEWSAALLASTGGVDQYNAKIAEINAQLPFYVQKLSELTPGQYAFAQALQATGASAVEIKEKLNQVGSTLQFFEQGLQAQKDAIGANSSEISEFVGLLGVMAAGSEQGAEYAAILAQGVADGSIKIQDATAALLVQTAALESYNSKQQEKAAADAAAAAATEEAKNSVIGLTGAIDAETLSKVEAENKTQALKLQEELLLQAATNAAAGLGGAGNAAIVMGQQFGIAEGQAASLIFQLKQLQLLQTAASSKVGKFIPGLSVAETALAETQLQALRKTAEVRKFEEETAFLMADTATQLDIKRKALGNLTEGTLEYAKANRDVLQLEQQLAEEAKRKKGGGSGGGPGPRLDNKILTAQEKLDNQLIGQQEKTQGKLLEARLKYQNKVLDIVEEFNKKQAEQDKKNEVSKRKNRADFYDSLADAQDAGLDAGKYASLYEAAFAEAQKLAQEGKKKLSQEFLDLKTEQIDQIRQLDEEAKKIQEDDSLSKSEKADRLKFLEGRRQLRQDAQDEETKQLLEGGDENQNALNEQLDKEAEAYTEATDKIIREADRAAEARIRASNRATDVLINNANRAAIAEGKGGIIPTVPTDVPIDKADIVTSGLDTGESVPVTTDSPLPIAADAPIPVIPTGPQIVSALDILPVRDDGVIAGLIGVSDRADAKLGEVISSIQSQTDTIVGRLAAVESAVRNIRIGSPSLVN